MNQIAKLDYMDIDGRIIIKIEIPIPQKEHFTLYKTYLTPIPVKNMSLSYIIDGEFIASNSRRSKFLTMSEKQYENCEKILISFSQKILLCEHKNVIYTNKKDKCLFNLFSNPFEKIPICDVRYTHTQNRLTKLISENSWLYTAHSPVKVIINCRENSTAVNLVGSGIITFKTNCEIMSENFILPVSGSRISTYHIVQPNQTYIPDISEINIIPPLFEEQTKHTRSTFEITDFGKHNNEILTEKNKIKHLETTMEKTQRLLEQNSETKSVLHEHKTEIFSITTIVLVAITAFIGYKIKQRCCVKSEPTSVQCVNFVKEEPTVMKPCDEVNPKQTRSISYSRRVNVY